MSCKKQNSITDPKATLVSSSESTSAAIPMLSSFKEANNIGKSFIAISKEIQSKLVEALKKGLAPAIQTMAATADTTAIPANEALDMSQITAETPGSPIMENGEIDPALLPNNGKVKTAGDSKGGKLVMYAGMIAVGCWILFGNEKK